MARLKDVNGAVQVINDRDQVVAVFDSISGLLQSRTDGVAGKTAIPTTDPKVKGMPYLSSGTLKYSNG